MSGPRNFLLVACAASALLAATSAAQARETSPETAVATRPLPVCPPEGREEAQWEGTSLLQGGKGYVDTPMGTVHYRLIGQGDGPVIVLLHQTPWSMVQFAEIQSCLAARGVRSLAIDTPGYGMSDAPQGNPTIAQYADNIVPVLDALRIGRVIVAGHHTGAAIATAFAARHADRTAGLLLHGTPLYTETERAERIAGSWNGRPIAPDGTHLSEYFQRIRAYVGDAPGTLVTANWSTLFWYLSAGSDVAHDAVFENDLGRDLAVVRSPVLILSDAGDSLHVNDQRAAAMRPWFRYRQFSEGRSHAMMIDPARWAAIAAAFDADVAAGTAPAPEAQ